jgi:hypothetical protein
VVSRETPSRRVEVGAINWKWLIIGAAVGYAGAVYAPKFLNRG